MDSSFDIGDLFYIIVTVLFIVAGAFGKKKKQIQQKQRETTVINSDNIPEVSADTDQGFKIEDLFKEYIQDDTIIPPENREIREDEFSEEYIPEKSEETPLKEFVTEEESYEAQAGSYEIFREEYDPIVELPINEMEHAYKDISEESAILDEIKNSEGMQMAGEGYNAEIGEMTEDFDARKAFLYSEIFNRRFTA